MTRWFLSHGANPNARAEILDITPLSHAVEHASFDIIHLLFDHRGHDSIKHGELIHYVARRSEPDYLEVMQFILDQGPELNVVMYETDTGSSYGFQKDFWPLGTALHDVAERGKFNLVRLLLDKGIDPLIRNCRGQLAVEVAQANGHGEIAEYLQPLSQGADKRACFTDQPGHRDYKHK